MTTLENVSQLSQANSVILGVALEERAPQRDLKVAEILKRFEHSFAQVIITIHPYGTEGEIPGKCSNYNFALRSIVEYLKSNDPDFDPRDYIVTNFDIDTRFHPKFLEIQQETCSAEKDRFNVRLAADSLLRRGLRVTVDGSFGPGTRRAVARLQRRSGLRVNGIVDRPLLWWLGLSVCEPAGPPGPRRRPRPPEAGGVRAARLRAATGASQIGRLAGGGRRLRAPHPGRRAPCAAAPGPAAHRGGRCAPARPPPGRTAAAGPPLPPPATTLLSVGDQGPGVRRLQAGLRRSGYTVAVNGAFGPRTRLAVARLQRKLGMRVNGAVNAKLLRRLGHAARRLEVFPVQAPHSFQNDFGAPRHQGPHEGIDVIAPRGPGGCGGLRGGGAADPARARPRGHLAVASRRCRDRLLLRASELHRAEGIAPGTRVVAGGRLGAVGRTGDARGGVFHLHFEMHPPLRGAVNPYAELRAVNPASAV